MWALASGASVWLTLVRLLLLRLLRPAVVIPALQAVVLEMIGDLPEAEAKPPSNVLFVCKLNPVTSEEDLEIIFSRFGQVVDCAIIRDWKTGDSLCYGGWPLYRSKEAAHAMGSKEYAYWLQQGDSLSKGL